jgi:hypothetical protein
LPTFWRRPVSRLKTVDLPTLGGPIIATVRNAGNQPSILTEIRAAVA